MNVRGGVNKWRLQGYVGKITVEEIKIIAIGEASTWESAIKVKTKENHGQSGNNQKWESSQKSL